MKSTTILIVLFAVVAVAVATGIGKPPPKKHCCPRNEVWSDCSPPGGGCERNCKNRHEEIGCAAVCTAKCYCRKGYLRNARGKCIPACKCPRPGRG